MLLKVEPMKRQDFRFSHRMRVRWVEVDMQKIVFNGHYHGNIRLCLGVFPLCIHQCRKFSILEFR